MASVRFRFRTMEFGDTDIHVRSLRDNQQFDDPNGTAEALGVSSSTWPLFGLVWESSEILAEFMQSYDISGLRILEVGCGLALSSLILNQRHADITASDHHPCAEEFLRYNTELNDGRVIPFICSGWSNELSTSGTFDLIIGSDILYQPDHAQLLAAFIHQHAKPTARVIIVDPRRGNANAFCREMQDHGFSHERHQPQSRSTDAGLFKGHLYQFTRQL